MSNCTSTFARRLHWVAGGLLVTCGLTVTACGSTGAPRSSRPSPAPTSTVSSPKPTLSGNINSSKQTASAPTATRVKSSGPVNRTAREASPTASTGPSFGKIAGWYAGGTADAGWLYIGSDGASRYRAPDSVACPTCMTASAPIASLDFSLSALSSTGSGAYTASGTVTATSDPAWATQISPRATVGSLISLTLAPGGRLSLSVLPPNDELLGPTGPLAPKMVLPVLYIPPSPFGGYSGRYPTTIAFSGDSGNIVSGISWTSWGPQEAVGHGTWTYQDCVPNCAAGSQTPYPATLTLSDPGGGQAPVSSSVYKTITEVRSGPHGGVPERFIYGSQGWDDPALAAH